MKKALLKILSCIAVFGAAMSACGLTIVPTFTASITNDPNGPAMVAAINAAIQVLQTNLSDNLTVQIQFTNDPGVDLGQSSTWGNNYSYSNFLAALKNSAADVTDTNAISQLTNSTIDPVIGGNKIYLTTPQARRLGLRTTYGSDGFDSTISLNMPSMNFTRPGVNATNYDLQSTAEHEMDEVLGISSGLPATNIVWPVDLFRYTTNLVRTFTTSGDNAYFSADGTNLVARYNMDPTGDYGDWWSVNGNNRWAPPGVMPVAQVQDAFGNPQVYQDLGVSELTALDVVGYTLAVTAPATPPIVKIFRSGANQFTLSWSNSYSGFVLQENTNLISGSWIASATGSTNPAVISSATGQKFYRLYKAATPALALAQAAPAGRSTDKSDQRVIHVIRLRQP
jgi:hypothetical protein